MSLNKTLLALALGLSLTACSGVNTKQKQIEAGCAVAVAANNTIAAGVRAGKVSEDTRDEALDLNEYIYPVCDNPTAPTVDSVKQAAFDAALAKLLVLKGEVQ